MKTSEKLPGLRLALALILSVTFTFNAFSATRVHADGTVLRVTRTGSTTDTNCGTNSNWSNPCSLVYALGTRTDTGGPYDLWVAAGIYTTSTTFQLKNGVALYGGYAGSGANPDSRDIAVNETILSGNSFAIPHVVTANGVDNTAILDGFTITSGNANTESNPNNRVGGGVLITSGSPILNNLKISTNIATYGAGIYVQSGNPRLANTLITDNEATGTSGGGGWYNNNGNPIFTNVTFTSNRASAGSGGAITFGGGNPILRYATILGNTATAASGGGIYVTGGSPTLNASIVWGNVANGSPSQITGTITVTYSDIQGWASGGTGNTNGEPLLGTVGTYGGPNQLYPLLPGSAAINAVPLDRCVAFSAPTDQRGRTRPETANGQCDMGSYEASAFTLTISNGNNQIARVSTAFANPLAVTITANTGGDPVSGGRVAFIPPTTGATAALNGGAAGAQAMATISAAGSASVTAIANGTAGAAYTVSANASGAASVNFTLRNIDLNLRTTNSGSTSDMFCGYDWNNPCALQHALADVAVPNSTYQVWVQAGAYTPATTFTLPSGVAMYGGFSGDETALANRHGGLSVLSGGQHVVTIANGATASTVLDGFSIRNGNTAGDSGNPNGGGIFNNDGAPRLSNLTIMNNTAGSGGGIYNVSGSPTLTNVTISGNTASTAGGGIGTAGGTFTLRNSIVWGNNADQISGTVTATYSDIQNWASGGTGNIASDPLLGAAGTHPDYPDLLPLLPGSPAINAASTCAAADQRHVTRPQGAACDMGAYESQDFTIQIVSGDNQLAEVNQPFASNLVVSVAGTGNDPVNGGRVTFLATSDSTTGATATITGSPAIISTQGSQSQASASATAAVTSGSYTVAASAGASSTTFTLSNWRYVRITPNGRTTGVCGDGWSAGQACELAHALSVASNNDQLWVQAGAYTTTTTFLLKSGVAMYGGFAGMPDETSPTTRHGGLSVLSGGLHVVTIADLASTSTILDGFTIENGNASADTNKNGGGIYNNNGSPRLSNLTIMNNTAERGGGIYNESGHPTATNLTIYGNTSNANNNPRGGGIRTNGGTFTLSNSILWGNTPNQISNGANPIVVTYSDIQDGFSGTGNINADPLLGAVGSHPSYPDLLPLLPGSPAIDAGDDSAATTCAPADQRHMARTQGSRCDMGAYESQPFTLAYAGGDGQTTRVNTNFLSPLVVSVSVAGGDPVNGGRVTFTAPAAGASASFSNNNPVIDISITSGQASAAVAANGTSGSYTVNATARGAAPAVSFNLSNWSIVRVVIGGKISGACGGGWDTNSACELAHALGDAFNGDQIWVKEGTYTTTTSFTLKSGVALYGGFAGDETNLASRHGATSILSGGKHVVTIANSASPTTILDGFSITGGNTTGDTNLNGGGIYINTGSPRLSNLTILNNTARAGGGIYNASGSPLLTNVTFSGNTASTAGGGINTAGGTFTLRNSIVWGNTPDQISNGASPINVTYSDIQGGFSGIGNTSADPLLGAAGTLPGYDNILPLLPGSAAINAGGPAATCAAADQRHIARPQGGVCDMGAYESQPFTLALVSGDNQTAPVNTAFDLPLIVSITGAGSDPVDQGQITFTPNPEPVSGASAAITSSPATVSGGQVSVTAAANSYSGPYTVTAAASGAAQPVTFNLINAKIIRAVSGGRTNDTGSECGLAWADGCELWYAVQKAGPYDHVWAKEGTYNPALTDGSYAPTATFSLVRKKSIFGGFAGDESKLSDRHGRTTILSGYSSTYGRYYHVVTISANDLTAEPVLDGLSIIYGYASPDPLNSAGGGVYNYNSKVNIRNVTFYSNEAISGGAFYTSAGAPVLENVTMVNNFASSGGGSVYAAGGAVALKNSIVWGNFPDQFAGIGTVSASYSDIQSIPVYPGTGNISADPVLGAYNSLPGFPYIFPLLPGSPAINAGSATCQPKDQRGITRPAGGNCDMGAFESQPFSLTLVSGDEQPAQINTDFAVKLTVSVTGTVNGTGSTSYSDPVNGGIVTFTPPAAGVTAALNGGAAGAPAAAAISAGQAFVAAKANGLSGDYTVAAAANGASPDQTFHLSNWRIIRVTTAGDEVSPTCGAAWTAPCGLANALALPGKFNRIWVQAGTYTTTTPYQLVGNRRVHGGFAGNEAALIDRAGNASILRGNASGVVTVQANTNESPLLDRFVITQGDVTAAANTKGGGVYLDGGSPTLQNLMVSSSKAADGGGIYINSGSPRLVNLTITGNTATGSGGGVYANSGGSPTLVNLTIYNNAASGTGGGVEVAAGAVTLANGIIWGNTTDQTHIAGGALTASYSDIQNATADPANHVISSDPLLGTLWSYGGTAQVFPLLPGSPAIDSANSDAAVCPAADQRNVPRPQGGGCDMGAFESRPVTLSFLNCNDRGAPINQPFTLPLLIQISSADPVDQATVTFTAPAAGASADLYDPADKTWKSAVPAAIASGQVSVAARANGVPGDYAITASIPGVTPVTYIFNNRPAERTVFRVTAGQINDAHTCGSQWSSTCGMQYALQCLAGSGDELWLKSGTYIPTTNPVDTSASFRLLSGLEIYGGFNGTETARSARDWNANPTLLSGLVGANNVSHVVTADQVNSSAILDGFTVQNGKANNAGSSSGVWGGGILLNYSSPQLANLVVTANTASYGGGLYSNWSSPTLTNVTFSNNQASIDGGGLYNNYGSPAITGSSFKFNTAQNDGGGIFNYNSSPSITGSMVYNNTAKNGGGVYNNWSSPTLTYVQTAYNHASNDGGGIYNANNSSPTFAGNASGDLLIANNDAMQNGGGVFNESSSPVFNHVTILSNTAGNNAATGSGGGMHNYNSSPTLVNVIFQKNHAAKGNGGGMHNIFYSRPLLNNVDFLENNANNGGGLFNDSATSIPILSGGQFATNKATMSGGGMYNQTGSPTLDGLRFEKNTASASGGGLYIGAGSLTVKGTAFVSNAAALGGGVYNAGGGAALSTVTFNANTATDGGGWYTDTGDPARPAAFKNVTFFGNLASGKGGGMFNKAGTASLFYATFTGNGGTTGGSGIYSAGGSLTVTSSILWGNTVDQLAGAGTWNVTYSTVQAGFAGSNNIDLDPKLGALGDYGGPTQTVRLLPGSGAIDQASADQCDAAGTDQRGAPRLSGPACDMGAYEYSAALSIISGSPQSTLINSDFDPLVVAVTSNYGDSVDQSPITYKAVQSGAGASAVLAGNAVTDATGRLSIQATANGTPGAFTVTASAPGTLPVSFDLTNLSAESILRVVENGSTDPACGSGWTTAAACDFQYALKTRANTTGGTKYEVWVMKGTYYPTANSSDRTAAFVLRNGVAIYGGFAGTETGRSERNSAANPTILSGDIDLDDTLDPATGITTQINGNNSYHVVYTKGVDATAVLSDVTITGGQATGGNACPDNGCGGGLLNYNGSPKLQNLVIRGNVALFNGGGLVNFASDPTSPMTMMNIHFINNVANNGAGAYNFNIASLSLDAVFFESNKAGVSGGGMYSEDSGLALNDVAFRSNQALTGSGGGAYNDNVKAGQNAIFNKVSYDGNAAAVNGGGVYSTWEAGEMQFTNGAFISNSAGNQGGGIYNTHSKLSLAHLTFNKNTANEGSSLFNYNASNTRVNNSILWDATSTSSPIHHDSTSTLLVTYSDIQGGYSGSGNIAADPVLGAPGSYGGLTTTLPLLPTSPVIDAADQATCASFDQRNVARPQGSGCDMGAYEARAITLTISGGDDQTTDPYTAFTLPLEVTVTGAGSDPVDGGLVTFTAPTFTPPAAGPSALITGSPATIAQGKASVTATANSVDGGPYLVTASAPGATSVQFRLTNHRINNLQLKTYLPFIRR